MGEGRFTITVPLNSSFIATVSSNAWFSIKINVVANDFDPYICFWLQDATQCGGLNNSVRGGIIDNYRCYFNFYITNRGILPWTTTSKSIYIFMFR